MRLDRRVVWWLPLCLLLAVAATSGPTLRAQATGRPVPARVRVYLSTADAANTLTRQPDLTAAPATRAQPETITIRVDDRRRYQQIDGFGGALTDTAAWLLDTKLTPAARDTVLHRLFDPDPRRGIGISLLRVPMGASDFTKDGQPYSYDDLPAGQTDPTLAHFSIQHDLAYIVPVLRAALRINPRLKLIASPWSPPGWMKATPASGLSGTLAPSAYAAFAAYIVRFLQAYRAHGIPIYAVTPQNEPGASPTYPGIVFPAPAEAAFVADDLGPALVAAHLRTRILAYDGQWSTADTTPHYPFVVMADAAARSYLAGTAWHCYAGSPDVMTRMHDAYPHKDTYETECSSGIDHGDSAELLIAAARNWSNGTLLWNLALDTHGGPKDGTGCPGCGAPVIVDQATGQVAYTDDYDQLGQVSAFVRPGAIRLASTALVARYTGRGYGCADGTSYGSHTVDDVAFRNPDGSTVLIAYNAAFPEKTIAVRWGGQAVSYTLPACATATFVWPTALSRPQHR